MSKLTDFHVAVLATHGFEEAEVTEPVKALTEAGAVVTIVSPEPGKIQGVRHDLNKTVKIKVDRLVREIHASEFDALHLPGGTVNADSLRTLYLNAVQRWKPKKDFRSLRVLHWPAIQHLKGRLL